MTAVEKTCSCFGHSDVNITDELTARTRIEIDRAIKDTAIYYRNLAMIDQSDLILFWVEKRENSGAYKTYRYAVKKHKHVVNLFT